jgi:hypothetical protein
MNDSIKEQKSDKVLRLATELNRTLLQRPDNLDIHEVAKQWLSLNVASDDFPVLALNVQIIALCEMVSMYEIVSRASVSCVASLLEKDKFETHEAIEIAKQMIGRAGELLITRDREAGATH